MSARVLYPDMVRGASYVVGSKTTDADRTCHDYRGWRVDPGNVVVHLFGVGRQRAEIADRDVAYVITAQSIGGTG